MFYLYLCSNNISVLYTRTSGWEGACTKTFDTRHPQLIYPAGSPKVETSNRMTDEAVHPIIRSSIPVREVDVFGEVSAFAVFPDRRRMATNSSDGVVRIWDLKNGDLLKELEGRSNGVAYMTISRDGQLIASSDSKGYVMIWHGDTGRPLTQPFQAHSYTCSLDFSPDSATLATGSSDNTVKLWSTDTWQLQGTSFNCSSRVASIRYSPSGELLVIATCDDIQIWNLVGRARTARFGHGPSSVPLVWMPDGKSLLWRNRDDSIIRQWDSLTWKQVGDIWKGDSNCKHFAVNCNGSIVASVTAGNHIRLWRFSNRQTIAIFQEKCIPRCIAFSMDGKRILVGSLCKVSEWAVPEHAWPEDTPGDRATCQVCSHLISINLSFHFLMPRFNLKSVILKLLRPRLKTMKLRCVSTLDPRAL